MSVAVARVGDKTYGVCSAHITPIEVGGTIITGSSKSTSEGFFVARLGDKVLTDCGHESTIITASSKAFDEGVGVAMIGDKVGDGPYDATIISGANATFVSP